jgi:hypothetical protein
MFERYELIQMQDYVQLLDYLKTNLSEEVKTLAEFSTLGVAILVHVNQFDSTL